jgi:hypothetical protein
MLYNLLAAVDEEKGGKRSKQKIKQAKSYCDKQTSQLE